jgi:hypothetical protein
MRPARFGLRTTRSRIRAFPDEPERRGWHTAPNVEYGARVGRSSTKRPDAKAKSHSVRRTKAPPARRSSVRTPFFSPDASRRAALRCRPGRVLPDTPDRGDGVSDRRTPRGGLRPPPRSLRGLGGDDPPCAHAVRLVSDLQIKYSLLSRGIEDANLPRLPRARHRSHRLRRSLTRPPLRARVDGAGQSLAPARLSAPLRPASPDENPVRNPRARRGAPRRRRGETRAALEGLRDHRWWEDARLSAPLHDDSGQGPRRSHRRGRSDRAHARGPDPRARRRCPDRRPTGGSRARVARPRRAAICLCTERPGENAHGRRETAPDGVSCLLGPRYPRVCVNDAPGRAAAEDFTREGVPFAVVDPAEDVDGEDVPDVIGDATDGGALRAAAQRTPASASAASTCTAVRLPEWAGQLYRDGDRDANGNGWKWRWGDGDRDGMGTGTGSP